MKIRTDQDAVVDELRQGILAGEFPPGSRLTELDLSDRLGAGRAAVRAALLALEKERLVERAVNRGATVRRVSLAEVIQITEARQALEGLCAAQAASHASEADVAELNDIARQMRSAVTAEQYLEYSGLNKTLHRRICEISRHQIAAEMITTLRNQAAHHQFRLALQPGRPLDSVQQHETIVDAISSRDAETASKAMQDHLQSVITALRTWSEQGVMV